MKAIKIILAGIAICALASSSFADCMGTGWICDKTVEKIGTTQNYQGTQYAWFTVVGDNNWYAIDFTSDFGKKQYALLIAAKTNGSLIHYYTGGVTAPNALLWGSGNNAISATNLYVQ